DGARGNPVGRRRAPQERDARSAVAMRSPRGELDDRFWWPDRGDAEDRTQRGRVDLRLDVVADDPPAYPATVQRDAHDRPDPEVLTVLVGYRIIKRPRDRNNIRDYAANGAHGRIRMRFTDVSR